MAIDKSVGYMPYNSREKEKEKLIQVLSEPKLDFPTIKLKSTSPFKVHSFASYDEREKEKDRLAAIFASSSSQFSNSMNCEMSKNRSAATCAHQYDQFNTKNKKSQQFTNQSCHVVNETLPEHLSNKYQAYNIPEITISQYSKSPDNDKMVTNQMLTTQVQDGYSCQFKDASTQTELIGTTSTNENVRMIQEVKNAACTFPLPKRCSNLSEKEIKEYLYRKELQKQIEEKNFLKAELKRREAEEEAKLEDKIRRDQEKIRRQFEEESLMKLELAIKKELEESAKQILAAEQIKTAREMKGWKEKIVSSSNICKPSANVGQSELAKTLMNQSKLLTLTSDVLNDELTSELSKHNLYSTFSSQFQPELGVPTIELAQPMDKIEFNSNTSQNNSNAFNYLDYNDKIKDVEHMLKRRWVPDRPQDFPPISMPLPYATIPPISPSLQRTCLPISSSESVIGQIDKTSSKLEDRKKVPYEKNKSTLPTDTMTKHNSTVLTQLGEFRRHLQQERVRMQQRIQDDSP